MYSRRKYYCYHQNAKYFLLPFENGNFSNIAIVTVILSLSPLRARKIDNFRKEAIKKEAKILKRMQRGLRVITLQGAIEESPILLSQYWKNE